MLKIVVVKTHSYSADSFLRNVAIPIREISDMFRLDFTLIGALNLTAVVMIGTLGKRGENIKRHCFFLLLHFTSMFV